MNWSKEQAEIYRKKMGFYPAGFKPDEDKEKTMQQQYEKGKYENLMRLASPDVTRADSLQYDRYNPGKPSIFGDRKKQELDALKARYLRMRYASGIEKIKSGGAGPKGKKAENGYDEKIAKWIKKIGDIDKATKEMEPEYTALPGEDGFVQSKIQNDDTTYQNNDTIYQPAMSRDQMQNMASLRKSYADSVKVYQDLQRFDAIAKDMKRQGIEISPRDLRDQFETANGVVAHALKSLPWDRSTAEGLREWERAVDQMLQKNAGMTYQQWKTIGGK